MSPSADSLHSAREEFRDLLASAVTEATWQRFFAQNPFVFSRALPIRVSPRHIVPMARPGKSDPDFIFYQRRFGRLHGFGVIELKRPDSRILTLPRKDLVLLTRDAATAVRQTAQYATALNVDRVMVVGVPRHLFVIMGLSDELAKGLASEILAPQIERLAPGCQIIPFDELLRRFEDTLPERVVVLAPRLHDVPAVGPPAIFLATLLDQVDLMLGQRLAREPWIVEWLEFKRGQLETFAADPENLDARDVVREVLSLFPMTSPASGLPRPQVARLRRLCRAHKMRVLGALRALLAAGSRDEPDEVLDRFANEELLYIILAPYFGETDTLASFLRVPYETVKPVLVNAWFGEHGQTAK
jgi:hypothetical protein